MRAINRENQVHQSVMQLSQQRTHAELPSEALLQRQIMEKSPSCPTIIEVNVEPVISAAAPSSPAMRAEVCRVVTDGHWTQTVCDERTGTYLDSCFLTIRFSMYCMIMSM
ncbi:Hypothetical protein SMAX5B_009817 [Scophthalmus maximus]|uniref:Uncharacterized protein n=1 Tax=Scophthalmus maximus TaxID=52904 RepID=A0A2U9BVD9_SCOMX|nr:Hypothetical protein SMAX5B_009817 [Scophthalmus maximus]